MKSIVIIMSLVIAQNINSFGLHSERPQPPVPPQVPAQPPPPSSIPKIMELGNYESISINGPFQVQLYSGKEGKIELTGNNTATELIEIFIHNDELIIRPIERNWVFKSLFGFKDLRKIKANIPVEDINKISLNGSGTITSKDILENKKIEIKLNGSGNIEVNLNSKEAITKINGSGTIELIGKTEESELKVNGSGTIKAKNLLSRIVDAKINGSGTIELFSTNKPNKKINGSGTIKSFGPNKVNHKIIDID